MFHRKHVLVTAALVVAAALPSGAMAQQDLRSPDARDAADHRGMYGAAEAAPSQDLRSPDARDAARDLSDQVAPPPSSIAASSRADYQDLRSPDARDAARRLPPVETPVLVQARDVPERGFDWGDAGIGAAAMLALFGIAAGAALIVTGRRRGRSVRVATH